LIENRLAIHVIDFMNIIAPNSGDKPIETFSYYLYLPIICQWHLKQQIFRNHLKKKFLTKLLNFIAIHFLQ